MIQDLILQQAKGALQNTIFNKIIALNPNIPSSVLRAVVSRVAEEASVFLVSGVNLNANKQLNIIPQNLIGLKNPVNLVSSNLGPSDLTNNLGGILQTQMSSQVTNKIITLLESQLRLALPASKYGIINFSAIAAILAQTVTPTVNSAITGALGGFAQNIFGRGTQPQSIVPNISNYFQSGNSDSALEKIGQLFNSSTASSALNESKKFNINNTDNRDKLIVLENGFRDPSANYPTKEYAGLSETNKLAQGDPRGTIVTKKNKEKMVGAKLPFGSSWDQPESAYRGAYPYNKVTQTESGHVIEIDDTPGSERLHIYHRSGTFIEIDGNGSVIKRAVGSSYEIIDRNGKIAIAGSADISVNGACNIFVGNDANIEVEGDVNLKCHNDITAQAGGTLNLSATEEVNITGGNINIESYDVFNMKANSEVNIHSSDVIHMHSNAEIKVQTVDMYTYATDIAVESTADHNTKVGGSAFLQTGGATNILAGGNFNVDGAQAQINSGAAVGAQASTQSQIAGSSNIGILSGRKDIGDNSLLDPQALSMADNRSLLLEEETQTQQDKTNQKNILISEGFATAAEIDSKAISIENNPVQSEQKDFVEPDENLKKATALPGNYNLSPNFTVEMLSNKAAVSRDPIRAHGSLKYGDIAYNLQALALNVLEPVKKIYPNVFVTSAFRDPGNGSNAKTSQHPLGKGVDIQFKGATKKEYYDIAINLAKVIRYDQFILEFCNYTNNPWIHISYSVDKNRSQVLTFFNHQKHSDGISQLA